MDIYKLFYFLGYRISLSEKRRKTTSIKINPELWKRVKKHCIDTDISDFIEKLLKKNLPK